jgi:uncharacterized protein YpiB (UPF0302 family)
MLNEIDEDENILRQIIFTDEVLLQSKGLINHHNSVDHMNRAFCSTNALVQAALGTQIYFHDVNNMCT